MPSLSQIQTLVHVAECGSLVAAAKELQVTPAAISKQITLLEEELGIQLLIRSTRKVDLTEVGANYYQQCKRILEEVEAASSLVSQVKATPSGSLKVVSARYFANSYIIPHIKEFLIKYPKIELSLELAERLPDLNLEAIDVLIGMSLSATGDVIQKRIATTSYALCASPQYLKKFGTPKRPSDLKTHRYITHSMRVPDNELQFNTKETVKVHPFIRVNDAQTMLQFTLEGLGIVKLHRYVVKDHLEKGTLKELLASYNHPDIPLYAAFPNRRFIPSKVRCFIDFVTSKL